MGSLSISTMNLSAAAKKGAEAMLKAHPDVIFTSGRRDLGAQAKAMAGNVVTKRDYIKGTYTPSDASKACQKWVDDNPDAKTQSVIAAGLLETLTGLGAKAGQISKHLTGDAFDVKPVTKDAAEIKKTIGSLPGKKKFLEKEAGLVIWHVEF